MQIQVCSRDKPGTLYDAGTEEDGVMAEFSLLLPSTFELTRSHAAAVLKSFNLGPSLALMVCHSQVAYRP